MIILKKTTKKKNKPLFYSQIPFNHIVVILGLLYLLVKFCIEDFQGTIVFNVIFIVLLGIILWYENIYYLYDDKIKIVYIFRPWKRERIIKYEEIELVEYLVGGGKGQYPVIAIAYNNKKIKKILKPSNSFTHWSYKKRKEILKFLSSKGLLIKVYASTKKEKEILK